jgi:hypothetical protein
MGDLLANVAASPLEWGYAGPVARAYELSDAPVAVIVGPTGGGKSTGSARKVLRAALKQHPSPRDQVRRCRICVVTPTYPKAWDTVIPSYKKVIPWGDWKGSPGRPADHRFSFDAPLPRGGTGRVDVEVMFRATKDVDLEEFVRGLEVTGWWIPEMDTLDSEHLISLTSNRVGRYPEPDDRVMTDAPAWAGVFGDANAPVVGGWFHERFYLHPKPGDAFFRQPSGFSPRAENLQNLRKIRSDYYAWLASGMEDYDIGRLIGCKPGFSRFGKPVYEIYDDEEMTAPGPLKANPNALLVIGADCGNTLKPAASFKQRAYSGQHRTLAEICPGDQQMDIITFGQEIRRIKDSQFGDVEHAIIIADPSAAAKAATSQEGLTYAAILQGASGIEVQLAPTNDPGLRRAALRNAMKRRCAPDGPGILIDPRCTGIRKSLSGGHRFRKVGNSYAPTPEKGDESHPAEAEEYASLWIEGLGGVSGALIPPHAGAGQSDDQTILPS